MLLSGLEPLRVDANSLFINIGERTNVTGSKAFARLILNAQFEDALAVARQQGSQGGSPGARAQHRHLQGCAHAGFAYALPPSETTVLPSLAAATCSARRRRPSA